MAALKQGDGAPALRRELEAARGGHVRPPGLADHCAEAAMAQPLLHHREQFGIVLRLGIEEPLVVEPRLRQTRREQIPPPHHPQHRAPGARGDPGHEQGRGGIITHAGAGRGNLVQRIEPEPGRRQPRIDRADPEGQHRTPAQPIPLDPAKGFA